VSIGSDHVEPGSGYDEPFVPKGHRPNAIGLVCMLAMRVTRPAFSRGETMHTGLSISGDDQVVRIDAAQTEA
jgi:hypothetical protein